MGKIKTSQIKEQSRWSPNQVYSFRRELLKCLIIGYYYKSLYLDNRAVSFSSLAQNSKHYSLKFSSVLHFSIWKQTHQYKKYIYIYISLIGIKRRYLLCFREYSLEDATICRRVHPSLSCWFIVSLKSGFWVNNHLKIWFLPEIIKKIILYK